MRPNASSLLLLLCAACAPWSPSPRPDPSLYGCYRLKARFLHTFGDSLGYPIPPVIRLLPPRTEGLDPRSHVRGVVLPSGGERVITWTNRDDLPSSRLRLWEQRQRAPVHVMDSILTIPGDSIDIRFHGYIGDLVLRLKAHGAGLSGRAEWVVDPRLSYSERLPEVVAVPESCNHLGTGGSS